MAGTKKRILLVDDDALVRRVTARLLEHHGFVAICADGGLAAMERLHDQEFDAVVCDVSMSPMSGPQLLDAMLDQGIVLPFMFISGFTGESLAHLKAPLLCKPFTSEQLMDSLGQLIG